jgi:hypothetical protein
VEYRTLSGYTPDFEVHYRFLEAQEGGRSTGPPYQGFRCDWAYDGDDISHTGMYMNWPEFKAENGNLVAVGERGPSSGSADMWILSHEYRERVHRKRIAVGAKGYFMEGSRKVAVAVVSRVIGLHLDDARTSASQ